MTKRAGFVEIHIEVHYYVTSRDLSNLADNWRERESQCVSLSKNINITHKL